MHLSTDSLTLTQLLDKATPLIDRQDAPVNVNTVLLEDGLDGSADSIKVFRRERQDGRSST